MGSYCHIKTSLVLLENCLFLTTVLKLLRQSVHFKLGKKVWNRLLTEGKNLLEFCSSLCGSDILACSKENFSFRKVHLKFSTFDSLVHIFSFNLTWMLNSAKRSNLNDTWNNEKINQTVTSTECKVITQYEWEH